MQDRVVDPLLKHEFDNICGIKDAVQDVVVEVPKPCSWSCKLSNFLSGFFSSAQPRQEKSEL